MGKRILGVLSSALVFGFALLLFVAPATEMKALAQDERALDQVTASSDNFGDASRVSSTLQASSLTDSTPRAKRTIMLYVCGADLEEYSGMASQNLEQVLNANFGNGEDVRFVVMTGGSYRWFLEKDYLVFPDDVAVPDDAVQIGNQNFDDEVSVASDPKSQISGPYNQIWEAKSTGAADNPGKLVLLDGDGLKNGRADAEGNEQWMSDPETLKSFINYSVENFPAEKYDLILWDHGGGETDGFALDWRRPQLLIGSNSMSFAQIVDALKDNEVVKQGDDDPTNDATFDFVDFDACLMGSTEITLGIADYTDYYIASPETIPGRGQLYTGWLDELGKDSDAKTDYLGKKIVDDFIAYYEAGYEDGTRQEATLALINMKKLLGSGFVDALCSISDSMRSQVESGLFYDELRSVKSSIKYEGSQFYDLGNFVSHLGISFWELEADDVEGSRIDYTNEEYTEYAKTLVCILSNPDIVYARNTSGINKQSTFFIDADGNRADGVLRSSGLHLFFPPGNNDMAAKEYQDAVLEAAALMPDDNRATFLRNYAKTLQEYNFVRAVGRYITDMVNSGYDKNAIDYARLREYWNTPQYPNIEGLEDYSKYEARIAPIIKAMDPNGNADAAEAEIVKWLDNIVKQQALEAVSADNVTANSFITKGGEGSKIQIENTRRRAVSGVSMNAVAELPAVRAYIAEHDAKLEDPYGSYAEFITLGQADLPLGSVSASIDASMDTIDDSTGDFIRDYVNWFNNATTATWNIDPLPRSWYAIKDANGVLHVAFNDDGSTTTNVPMIRMQHGEIGDNPELNLLGFTDGKLTQIYLHDDEGNARIIKASDLKTEMEFMPALYLEAGFEFALLPASFSSMKVSPDTIDDIELVYTDVDNIRDIQDVDDDGDAFGFKYTVSDIYGANVNITEKVEKPARTIIDIRLAKVESALYTGKALSPKVIYDGNVLVEGVDYVWDRDDNDDPIVLPGDYGITVLGIGNYADMLIDTFTVKATEDDIIAVMEAEEGIRRALAKIDMEALEAGDADSLAAAREALALYGSLTDAQKTQVDTTLMMALLDVSQKALEAYEKGSGSESHAMLRLYNPHSGEHLYTSNVGERDTLVEAGWAFEGEAWTAPNASATPVYRLYNGFEPLGDHHYTTDKAEYDSLIKSGWIGEGIAWYSDDAMGTGLLRLYNPNAYSSGLTGAHHYTADLGEAMDLSSLGWSYEGIGWYGKSH